MCEFVLHYVRIEIKLAKGEFKSFKFGVSSVEDIERQLHDNCPDLVDVGPIIDIAGAPIRSRKDIKHGAELFANDCIFKGSRVGRAAAPRLANPSLGNDRLHL